MKEVLNDEITAGEKDYSALVSKLKAANVDVIYFGGYHPEAALIVKQSREQGLNAQLLSGDSLNTQEFATLAGDAANGVMFTNAAEARNLPSAKAVVEEFRKDGFEPEGYTLSTYAAIQAYAMAVAKAGTTDPEKVAATLRSPALGDDHRQARLRRQGRPDLLDLCLVRLQGRQVQRSRHVRTRPYLRLAGPAPMVPGPFHFVALED